jgi:hypothetical protein
MISACGWRLVVVVVVETANPALVEQMWPARMGWAYEATAGHGNWARACGAELRKGGRVRPRKTSSGPQ